MDKVLGSVLPKVDWSMNEKLLAPYTQSEVEKVMA